MVEELICMFCHELNLDAHAQTLIDNYHLGNIRIATVERDGRVVGISGYAIDGVTGQGELWYVLPEYRGSRVAHELFTESHKDAKEQGCIAMRVIARETRKNLYLKHGYDEEYAVMTRGL